MPKYKEVKFSKATDKGYELVTYDDPNAQPDYYWNGSLHRLDGPAFEDDGSKEWWINGQPLDKDWFLENPDKINKMKAWELFEPEELIRLKLAGKP